MVKEWYGISRFRKVNENFSNFDDSDFLEEEDSLKQSNLHGEKPIIDFSDTSKLLFQMEKLL